MKRPLAVFGLTLFVVLAVLARLQSLNVVLALALVCGAVSVISLCFSKCRRALWVPVISFSALLGCLLLLLTLTFVARPAERAARENAELTATAAAYPTLSANKKRYYVTAKVKTPDGGIPGMVRLSLPAGEDSRCDFAADVAPGDVLRFHGTLYVIAQGNNEIRQSFGSRRIFLGAYPTGKATLEQTHSRAPFYLLLKLRQSVIGTLRQSFSADVSGVMISLLFGDKTYLSDNVYQTFRDAGVAHLLAVSGLHLSVWVLFLYSFFQHKASLRRKAALASMLLTVAVMALAMFTGSVLRAGFMLLLYLLGGVLHRESDGLNSLGFAVTVCLCAQPYLALNVGFMLSVLSTLSIFVFALPLKDKLLSRFNVRSERLRRFISAVLTALCISFSASVFTAPVLVYAFGTVSLVSLVTNLLFLPLTVPLLLSCGLFALFSWVPLLSAVLSFAAKVLVLLALKIAAFCASLPFATVSVERVYTPVVLLGAACVFALYLLLCGKKRRGRVVLSVSLAVVLCACITLPVVHEQNVMRLVVADAETGSFVYLKRGADVVLLSFDCDDYHAELHTSALLEQNVRVAAVIVADQADAERADVRQLSPAEVYVRSKAAAPMHFHGAVITPTENGTTISVYGNHFFLSDENTLALSEISAIIHTDRSGANETLTLTVRKNGSYRLAGESPWRTLMKKR